MSFTAEVESFTGCIFVNGVFWWARCLPLRPGSPGTPSVPSSPRDVRWKDGESATWILLEYLEGKVA